MPHESSIGETRVLLSGLGMGESPRWHDGRLWFSDWGTNEVVAVDLEGNAEVMAEGGGGSGWAANWLPDGRMLITGAELMRLEPDGSRVRHAELSSVSPYGWSEMTIDGRGNVYVNTINFDFADFSDVGPDEGSVCLRVREGGEVLHRIELDRPCYACMLGGEDGRTLFMVVARWFGPDRIDELQRARTGQVLAARVAVPHAGWP